jgi:hypothetical protein
MLSQLRRAFIRTATTAALGTMAFGASTFVRKTAAAVDPIDVQQQLSDIYDSPDGVVVRTAFADFVTSSSLAALAASQLPEAGTTFQLRALESMPIITRHAATVRAMFLGRLTPLQLFDLSVLEAELLQNDAVRTFALAGARRKRSTQLPTDIRRSVDVSLLPFSPVPLVGSQDVDGVITSFNGLRGSASFANVAVAAEDLLRSPEFIPIARTMPSLLIALFLPPNQVGQLSLPFSGEIVPQFSIGGFVRGVVKTAIGVAAVVVGVGAVIAGVATGNPFLICGGIVAIIAGGFFLSNGICSIFRAFDNEAAGSSIFCNAVCGEEGISCD